tara:strand:+ start:36013 stop:38277 length:2265 start_codon:yes stop_codon:yes gene_type:complete
MNKNKQISKDPNFDRELETYETPVPSREFILTTIKSFSQPRKMKHLISHFELDDPDLIEGLRRRLKAMIRDGQLVKLRTGFVPVESEEELEGELHFFKEREVYCITDAQRKIPLLPGTLRGCFEGDRVKVKVRNIADSDESFGRIIEIVEAQEKTVVGRFYKERNIYRVVPLEKNIFQHITIPKDQTGKAKTDDIVVVKLSRDVQEQAYEGFVGQVLEVLGDYASPGIEIDMAIKKFNIPNTWPKAVEKLSNEFPKKITPQSKRNREDLIDVPFITIDGEDAKDFDDAVYCQPTKTGWKVSVAIADVGHYVKPNTPLDKEAKRRGNSTYFPNRVVPMLPEGLSNQLCSLKPDEERLTLVCHMTVSKDGKVTRSKFTKAVIKSHARLTYNKVAKIYDGDVKLTEQYADVLPNIMALREAYEVLSAQRRKRGALDLETVDNLILFNDDGKIDKIIPVYRNDAHKVIEECMLAANVCAARLILRHKKPGLFRVHDDPPAKKLTQLKAFLSELGMSLKGNQDKPEASAYADILYQAKERPDRHVIETMVLRSLSQAQYREKNVGHFGLAYPQYVHFTSPIRRYPDLIIHRIIAAIIAEKEKDIYSMEALEELGEKLSVTERRSDDASRDATFALKCHYMQDKVGEDFEGVVSGVTAFGLFIELKDIYIEGLIHVSQLGHEYFHYDPVKHLMIGEHSRQTYQLGQEVKVKVVRVDMEDKKIDFELLDKGKAATTTKQSKNKKKRKKKKKPKHKNKAQYD